MIEILESPIAELVKEGTLRVHSNHHVKSFGDSVVELTSGRLYLRVVRDRSETAYDIRTPSIPEWYPLVQVFEFMGLSTDRIPDNFGIHLKKITSLMENPGKLHLLDEFIKAQSRALMGKIFPDN